MSSLTPQVVLALLVGLLALNSCSVQSFDYGDALDKTLLFFEAQRSGKLPVTQRVKWRGDSGLHDGYAQGVNLVGGYYDAGDHVKFGLPMAFTVTMLSWAAIDFKKDLISLNQLGHTLEAIKWGTNYFIKANPQPYVLWAQVGDGGSDHYCWERAEDMTTSRTAYKLDPENPGSDLAGETAAALAAASIAFGPFDSAYSNLLLVHAKQIFSFADRFRGLFIDSIGNARQFYTSSGYNVLLDGAGGQYASTLEQYRAKADYFTCACLQKNAGYNVHLTPGGLVYLQEWNNMQYPASAAFLLAVYSDYLYKSKNVVVKCPDGQLQAQDLINFAKSQADYILGKNPKSISYLVGYGQNYPIHVHHRGASITSISLLQSSVGCVEGFEVWYKRPNPNPNVVYGALVGGPNANDEFSDDRSNYEQTEPTLSGTAPLVGLFARLYSLPGNSAGSNGHGLPRPSTPYHKLPQGPNGHELPKPSTPYHKPQVVPVEFIHTITNSWTVGKEGFYRHKVIIKNVSNKPIVELKLYLENLSGSLWGLSPTQEKNTYELPTWLKVLEPGKECTFIYIQGGAQAKISVQSYH
ncbi:endoglucanase 5 [Striga asiatica]|uniref:Endoglucanase n=1 Tax=Striga asiatica TaxID=4170 RepID=A0A5A7R6V3_STRAF|nr:endoglucanase 5 [Striga asiatica]